MHQDRKDRDDHERAEHMRQADEDAGLVVEEADRAVGDAERHQERVQRPTIAEDHGPAIGAHDHAHQPGKDDEDHQRVAPATGPRDAVGGRVADREAERGRGERDGDRRHEHGAIIGPRQEGEVLPQPDAAVLAVQGLPAELAEPVHEGRHDQARGHDQCQQPASEIHDVGPPRCAEPRGGCLT